MEALIGHLPRTHTQLYSEIGNRFYVRASETDFNNMTRSGYFFGKFVQNTPDGTTDSNWIVEVQAFDNSNGWTFQRATRSSDKAIFTRIQDNGTWSDWEVLARKSDLYPSYNQSILFSNAEADVTNQSITITENGLVQAAARTQEYEGNPFIRLIINNIVVYEGHAVSGKYRYLWTPIFPVKKGDVIKVTLQTDSSDGYRFVYFYKS